MQIVTNPEANVRISVGFLRLFSS